MVATMTTSVKSVTDLRPGMENVEVIVQVTAADRGPVVPPRALRHDHL